jgi:hypothetical protein
MQRERIGSDSLSMERESNRRFVRAEVLTSLYSTYSKHGPKLYRTKAFLVNKIWVLFPEGSSTNQSQWKSYCATSQLSRFENDAR